MGRICVALSYSPCSASLKKSIKQDQLLHLGEVISPLGRVCVALSYSPCSQSLKKIQKTRLLHLPEVISPLGRIRVAPQIPLSFSLCSQNCSICSKKPRKRERLLRFWGKEGMHKARLTAPLHIPLYVCFKKRKCIFCPLQFKSGQQCWSRGENSGETPGLLYLPSLPNITCFASFQTVLDWTWVTGPTKIKLRSMFSWPFPHFVEIRPNLPPQFPQGALLRKKKGFPGASTTIHPLSLFLLN